MLIVTREIKLDKQQIPKAKLPQKNATKLFQTPHKMTFAKTKRQEISFTVFAIKNQHFFHISLHSCGNVFTNMHTRKEHKLFGRILLLPKKKQKKTKKSKQDHID